ncbi:MAG TPA: hypothetical protein VFI91_06335 [Longimicrobiaceae bacterium]|nr:hypothetical protein [Longimicrobiaceae bacterium]
MSVPTSSLGYLLILWWLGSASVIAGQSMPRLALEQIATYELPDSFEVITLQASERGSLVLRSPSLSYLLVLSSDGFYEVGAGALEKPVGAAFVAEQTIEIIDGGHNTIYRVNSGVITSSERFDSAIEASAAVRSDHGWFIGGRDSSGIYSLSFLGSDMTSREIYEIDLGIGGGDIRLGSAGKYALLTRTDPPFSTIMVDSAGTVQISFAADESWLPRKGAVDDSVVWSDPLWKALSVVQFSNHFIQTIADARSDRRVLLLFDQRGRQLRRTEIEAPFGFAGKIPDKSILVAVRKLGSQEIVMYRWRWSEDPLSRRKHNEKPLQSLDSIPISGIGPQFIPVDCNRSVQRLRRRFMPSRMPC